MKKTFLSLAVVCCLVAARAQTDNTIRQRTINVNGHSEIQLTPDEIYVDIELREYNKKNGDKIDISTIRDQFLTAVKSMNIADTDVVVQSYSGWDGNYWYYQKKKKSDPDLKAGITYEIKVKTADDMDKLVDKLDDQATQNFYISRTSHSNIDEIKKQLKIQAVKSAKYRADYLAAALDAVVGVPLTINDPSEDNDNPQPMYKMMLAGAASPNNDAAPMNVDFKKIKIEMNVNVIFELK